MLLLRGAHVLRLLVVVVVRLHQGRWGKLLLWELLHGGLHELLVLVLLLLVLLLVLVLLMLHVLLRRLLSLHGSPLHAAALWLCWPVQTQHGATHVGPLPLDVCSPLRRLRGKPVLAHVLPMQAVVGLLLHPGLFVLLLLWLLVLLALALELLHLGVQETTGTTSTTETPLHPVHADILVKPVCHLTALLCSVLEWNHRGITVQPTPTASSNKSSWLLQGVATATLGFDWTGDQLTTAEAQPCPVRHISDQVTWQQFRCISCSCKLPTTTAWQVAAAVLAGTGVPCRLTSPQVGMDRASGHRECVCSPSTKKITTGGACAGQMPPYHASLVYSRRQLQVLTAEDCGRGHFPRQCYTPFVQQHVSAHWPLH